MRVHRLVMPIIVIIALLGTVQLANALDWWQTSGQQLVDMDNFAATDIRGWMTVQQVADGLGIAPSELYRVLGLPADTPAVTAMKDLEELVEVSAARELLAGYLARGVIEQSSTPPAEQSPAAQPVEPTPVPTQAPQTGLTATHEPGTVGGPTPVPAGQLRADDIKGRMTLREISEGTGLPVGDILAEASLPATTSPNATLKDLISQIEGFEIQTVRDAVTRLLNR